MAKVQAKLTISEAAAVRAGRSEFGERVIDVDVSALTPAQRETLLALPRWSPDAPHVLCVRTPARLVDVPELPEISEATTQALATQLDRVHEYLETVQVQVAALVPQIIAAGAPAWVGANDYGEPRMLTLEPGYRQGPVYVEDAYLRAQVEYDPRIKAFFHTVSNVYGKQYTAWKETKDAETAKAAAEFKAAEEAREAEKASKEAARKAALNKWVMDYLSTADAARWNDGFMPESEVLDLMRDKLFAPLGDTPRYEKMTRSEVLDADEDGEFDHVEFATVDCEQLTSYQYKQLQKIKSTMKDADVKARDHVATIGNDERARKQSALVTLTLDGGITLSREYALKE